VSDPLLPLIKTELATQIERDWEFDRALIVVLVELKAVGQALWCKAIRTKAARSIGSVYEVE
jgi:hypothetical protein